MPREEGCQGTLGLSTQPRGPGRRPSEQQKPGPASCRQDTRGTRSGLTEVDAGALEGGGSPGGGSGGTDTVPSSTGDPRAH